LLKLTNLFKNRQRSKIENQLTGSVTTFDHEAEIVRFFDDHPSRHFKVARQYNEAKIATAQHWNAADHRPTDGCQWNRSSFQLDIYDIFQA
jgi:hypothetical protein